jgi:hypothetical protein
MKRMIADLISDAMESALIYSIQQFRVPFIYQLNV